MEGAGGGELGGAAPHDAMPQQPLGRASLHVTLVPTALHVILQSDGGQPFEIMQLRVITADEMQHEKLHKFQAAEYQKFTTGSLKLDVTNKPSPDVQNLLQTPREAKRLKVQHTADAGTI